MGKTAVYAGSFDPVTTGHIDIIERSCRHFDRVIVAVVHNVTKMALFSLEERVEMIRESARHLPTWSRLIQWTVGQLCG